MTDFERLLRTLSTSAVDFVGPLHPYLRGVPPGLPFQWDEKTLAAGVNFTLTTEAGALDLLGEMTGAGRFDDLKGHTIDVTLFGMSFRCVDLDTLIRAKRAAGRARDLEVVAELEAIREESHPIE